MTKNDEPLPNMCKLVFVTYITTILAQSSAFEISGEVCNGLYKLKPPKQIPNDITIGTTQARITMYPTTVSIGLIKRDRRTIYCYDGSALDPNTGCEEKYSLKNPDPLTALHYLSTKTCPTGHECVPDGNCWGNDASKCHDETMIHTVGPTMSKFEGSRWMMFPYHTCVSSWSCNLFNITVPTRLTLINRRAQLYYTSRDNEVIHIDLELLKKGKTTKDGFLHFAASVQPEITVEDVEVKCYSSNPLNIICSVLKNPIHLQGQSIKIGPDFIGILGTNLIKITGPINTIKDGLVTTLYSDPSKTAGLPQNKITALSTAASISDVIGVVNGVSSIQLQSLYNAEVLRNEISNLNNVIRNLIRILSKKNPTLLPSVMGMHGATHWLNEDIFSLCQNPTKQLLKHSNNSNCLPFDMIYSNGEIKPKKSGEDCISIEKDKVVDLDLVKSKDLTLGIANFEKITGATADSDTWETINNIRLQTLIGGNRSDHHQEQKEFSIIGWKPNWELYKEYFVLISCVMTWIIAHHSVFTLHRQLRT